MYVYFILILVVWGILILVWKLENICGVWVGMDYGGGVGSFIGLLIGWFGNLWDNDRNVWLFVEWF